MSPHDLPDNADTDIDRYLSYLLDRAEAQGFLTLDDVLETLPDAETDVQRKQSDLLCQALAEAGVIVCLDANDAVEDGLFPASSEEDDSAALDPEQRDPSDTIGLYLRDMARAPLLTLDEEVALARRINAGRCSKRALELGVVMDEAVVDELQALVANGQDAREALIKANTRLVVSIAKKYVNRGVPFQDLIQEGNLGLMHAVEKFDYTRGYRFSTYATWWIRQTISRAVSDQSRLIRLPVHMSDRVKDLYRAVRKMEQEQGNAPTAAELAPALGIDVRKVEWLMRVSWRPLSLEQPVNNDEDSELGAFIPDESAPTPPQSAQQNILHETIELVLGTLPEREAHILRLRFGLANGEAQTLEEVGAEFGLTRERIRQLENKALRRLRHPVRARQLRGFV